MKVRWVVGIACVIIGVAFWRYIFSGLYALFVVVLLLLQLPFAITDAIKLQYFIDKKQLLEDAKTVLNQRQNYSQEKSSAGAPRIDSNKLPNSIRKLHPTTVAVAGDCLVIERYPYASAYGYFACLPGGTPSGDRAVFVHDFNKKLDGLWYYATPSK